VPSLARWWLPCVALGATLLYVCYVASGGFEIDGHRGFSLFDDAMISMRYARNLAQGHGLRWNVGEAPVEGYSNLLWTAWMAVVQLLPIPLRVVSLWISLSSAALLVANLWLVKALVGAAGGGRRPQVFAVVSCAVSYPLVFWSLRGLEVGLLALLIDAAVLLAWRAETERRTPWPLAIVLSMMVLVRDDAAVPALVVVAYLVADVRTRPLANICALAVLGTLLAHLGFRLGYYGAPLPNTYYLKISEIPLRARLGRGTVAVLRTGATELLLLLVLGALGVARKPRQRRLWMLVAIVGGQVASTLLVGGDAWESWGQPDRFLSIAIPVLTVAAAIGAESLGGEGRDMSRASSVFALALLLRAIAIAAGDFVPRSFTVTPPWDLHPGLRGLSDATGVTVAALLFGTGVILVVRQGARAAPWAVAVLGAMVIAGSVAMNWRDFFAGERTARQIHWDNRNAIFGLKLGEVVSPATTIAVVAAGSIPFFSNLRAVDLLGKNDGHIAHEAPLERFVPGHDKRDYVYSLTTYTPDLVLELWHHSPEELSAIAALGYRTLPNGMYVRAGCPEALVDIVLHRLPEYPFATHRPPTLPPS